MLHSKTEYGALGVAEPAFASVVKNKLCPLSTARLATLKPYFPLPRLIWQIPAVSGNWPTPAQTGGGVPVEPVPLPKNAHVLLVGQTELIGP